MCGSESWPGTPEEAASLSLSPLSLFVSLSLSLSRSLAPLDASLSPSLSLSLRLWRIIPGGPLTQEALLGCLSLSPSLSPSLSLSLLLPLPF